MDSVALALNGVPLTGGMVQDLLEILFVDGIQDIEEVTPRGESVIWIGVLEVDVECFILPQVLPEMLHG